jgi:hypothetical protein
LNTHPEDPVSTKTVPRQLHKSDIHGRDATVKPRITESNAQMRKRWCYDHKILTLGNRKRARDMVRWAVLHDVPYIRKRLQSWRPGSNSETRERFCDGLSSNIVVFC